jgi:hypothetical protein
MSMHIRIHGLIMMIPGYFMCLVSLLSLDTDSYIDWSVLFRLYDHDNDGKISRSDLHISLLRMIGNEITSDEISLIIDKVFAESDTDRDGSIPFQEFEKVSQWNIVMIPIHHHVLRESDHTFNLGATTECGFSKCYGQNVSVLLM